MNCHLHGHNTIARGLVHGIIAVAVLIMAIGCQKDAAVAVDDGGQKEKSEHSEAGAQFTHNAGQVYSGAVVSYECDFLNATSDTLHVKSDQDIQLSCGCADLKLSTRTLKPGITCKIRMGVTTHGSDGAFDRDANIRWKTDQDKLFSVKVRIRGKAVPGFQVLPQRLVFDADEVDKRETQTVVISSKVPVDWSTLKIIPSSSALSISKPQIQENSASFEIRCSIPPEQETLEAKVLAQAETKGGVKHTPHLTKCSIQIVARQRVQLVIAPASLLLQLDSSTNIAHGRIMVRGERGNSFVDGITEVTTPGWSVQWKSGKSRPNSPVFVDLFLTPRSTSIQLGPNTLRFTSTDACTRDVPCLVIRSPVGPRM